MRVRCKISIRRFRNFPSGGLGLRALIGGTGRAFSLEVASLALTLKFSEAPEVLRAHFFARSRRFALDPRPPDSILEAETRGFSTYFDACTHPMCSSPKSTKHCAGARKLRFRPSAHVLKNGEKSTRSPFELTNVFKEGSGMVPGAVWNVLGCQFGVQDG